MPLIVRVSTPIGLPMVRLASKLLVLFAVLLMPLAMAPAAGAPQHQHSAMTMSMPMQHCPEPGPQQEKPGIAVCAMACASSLPALGRMASDAPVIVCAPQAPTAAQLLNGLHPETATPPPKQS